MNIVRYDTEVDALYIDLSEAPVINTEEIQPGVMVDYDREGNIVGVEILDFQARLLEPSAERQVAEIRV